MQVKCPITLFEDYVQDMKKNFKIEVVNLGLVSLDLASQLKPKYFFKHVESPSPPNRPSIISKGSLKLLAETIKK